MKPNYVYVTPRRGVKPVRLFAKIGWAEPYHFTLCVPQVVVPVADKYTTIGTIYLN